jgi:dipeptidyl aminopeptidase/acylaminoacyl peptidase
MRRLISFFSFLGLLALACSLPGSPKPPEATPDNRLVETMVANKLTSVAIAATPSPLPREAGTNVPLPPASNLVVVYVSEGNLWLWRENGVPEQLTSAGQDDNPRISSDGQVVVFTRGNELLAIDTDGSSERKIVTQAYLDSFKTTGVVSVRPRRYEFIPGSHRLLFDIIGLGDAFPYTYYDLHLVDADSPVPARIRGENEGGGLWAFSPDGQWLAIAAADSLRLMRPDGSDYRVLFKFKLISTYSEWFYFPPLVWMRDSSGLYTVIPAAAALDNPDEPSRFYFIPLKGDPARLAEFKAAPVWISMPQISPDGSRVAYMRQSGENLELHVIDASTSDRLFTSAPAASFGLLGWNPNSKDFTYFNTSTNNVWIARFDSPAVPLGDTPELTSLRWINDRRFLFINRGELRLRELTKPSQVIAADVSVCDFVVIK